jgi:hypothetical protein
MEEDTSVDPINETKQEEESESEEDPEEDPEECEEMEDPEEYEEMDDAGHDSSNEARFFPFNFYYRYYNLSQVLWCKIVRYQVGEV